MGKRYWRLTVSYPAEYRSIETDKDVEKILKTRCEGSGCGLGWRDLEFYFDFEHDARQAEQRLKDAQLFMYTETDIMEFDHAD